MMTSNCITEHLTVSWNYEATNMAGRSKHLHVKVVCLLVSFCN